MISRWLLGAAALSCAGLASAQNVPAPRSDASTEGRPRIAAPTAQNDDDEKKRREKERAEERSESPERVIQSGAPQAAADAPVPPQGGPTPPSRFERGPLSVSRNDFSLGFDRALNRQWVVAGLAGWSKARLHRYQEEFVPGSLLAPDPDLVSDTRVATQTASLAGVVSYFPTPGTFVDATVAFSRTHYAMTRVVNEGAVFDGSTAGTAYGLAATGGYIWRSGAWAITPQGGLEYLDARVGQLDTRLRFFGDTFVDEGFHVSGQHQKSWYALLGGQVQWVQGVPFGTVTPYVRTLYRYRLALDATTTVGRAVGANDVFVDPEVQSIKRALTNTLGVLVQLPRGVSAFAEMGWTHGANRLYERRTAVGVKLEI